MKSINALFLLFFAFGAHTQDREIFFQYHTNVKAIDTSAEVRQAAMMANNGYMRMYFADSIMRIEQKMGQTGTAIMIFDERKNVALQLMDSPMGKLASIRQGDEIVRTEVPVDTNAVVKEFNETKKILGYECRKIMLRSNGEIVTYWITDEIDQSLVSKDMVDPNIPGFPMEFSKIQKGLEMTYKISNIQFEIKDKETLFSLTPPEGYMLMPTSR